MGGIVTWSEPPDTSLVQVYRGPAMMGRRDDGDGERVESSDADVFTLW
jgi:hypothetical protein